MESRRRRDEFKNDHQIISSFSKSGIVLISVSVLLGAYSSAVQGAGEERKVSGSLVYNKETFIFNDVVAYKVKGETVVNLLEKPLDRSIIRKELKEYGEYWGLGAGKRNRLQLTFDENGQMKSVYLNITIGEKNINWSSAFIGNIGIKAQMTLTKTKVKGRVFTEKPMKAFDKDEYQFDVSFETEILKER